MNAAKPDRNGMFPKARLDALSDGIFGVAMTLLILDVRLPDDFQPKDAGQLLRGLAGLWPKFPPYVGTEKALESDFDPDSNYSG
jgi:uncharacterized membrane protein